MSSDVTMNNTNSLNTDNITSDNITDSNAFINASDINNDFQRSELFEFIVNGILICLVGIPGLFGNIVSMVILSRPIMRSSINCLLLGLATFDSLVVITSILIMALPSLSLWYYWHIGPVLTPVLYPIALMAQAGSIYLTMAVTIERYVVVYHPLKARSLCTYGRARYYVAGIAVFAILYNVPRFWETTNMLRYSKEYNETLWTVQPSELRRDPYYIQVYINWLYLIFMYLIPFVCLSIFNAAIYNQVRKANSEHQRLSRYQRKEMRLAAMLLCVVVVFFVCNVLAFVNNALESISNIIIDQLIQISNFLVTANSSVNFIIYCIFGEKFKRLSLKIFCKSYYYRTLRNARTCEDSYASNGCRSTMRTTLHTIFCDPETPSRNNSCYQMTDVCVFDCPNGEITNGSANSTLRRPLVERSNGTVMEPLKLLSYNLSN